MLYLASTSPRRRELLQQIGLTFEVLKVSVDETAEDEESPAEYVSRLAIAKIGVMKDVRRVGVFIERGRNGVSPPGHVPTAGLPG